MGFFSIDDLIKKGFTLQSDGSYAKNSYQGVQNKHTSVNTRVKESQSSSDKSKDKKAVSKIGRQNKGKNAAVDTSAFRTIFANFRHRDYRIHDNDGCMAAVLDAMVQSGQIIDDRNQHIHRQATGSTVEEQPGVDIVIIEIIPD